MKNRAEILAEIVAIRNDPPNRRRAESFDAVLDALAFLLDPKPDAVEAPVEPEKELDV